MSDKEELKLAIKALLAMAELVKTLAEEDARVLQRDLHTYDSNIFHVDLRRFDASSSCPSCGLLLNVVLVKNHMHTSVRVERSAKNPSGD